MRSFGNICKDCGIDHRPRPDRNSWLSNTRF